VSQELSDEDGETFIVALGQVLEQGSKGDDINLDKLHSLDAMFGSGGSDPGP
jgi:hypothetical protein